MMDSQNLHRINDKTRGMTDLALAQSLAKSVGYEIFEMPSGNFRATHRIDKDGWHIVTNSIESSPLRAIASLDFILKNKGG